MNLKEAIKATQSLPGVRTMLGNDAGPKLLVEVLKESGNTADLRVHARLLGRPPRRVALSASPSAVSVNCDIQSLVEAQILAEHLQQQVPGAGPCALARDGERFAVQFALPQPPAASQPEAKAEPQLSLPAELPAADAAEAPADKTTSQKKGK